MGCKRLTTFGIAHSRSARMATTRTRSTGTCASSPTGWTPATVEEAAPALVAAEPEPMPEPDVVPEPAVEPEAELVTDPEGEAVAEPQPETASAWGRLRKAMRGEAEAQPEPTEQ